MTQFRRASNSVTHFVHPSTFMIAGPTQCGKTSFVLKLLLNANALFTIAPQRIFWLYKDKRAAPIDALASLTIPIHFIQGCDAEFKKRYFTSNAELPASIIVLDDLMCELANSKTLEELFVEGSHHCNASVIYLVQNIFQRSSKHRTASINAHYLILFKMPRDYSQVRHLGQEMYLRDRRFFEEVYRDATEKAYGYLVVDCRTNTEEVYRLRTEIFPDEAQFVYTRPEVYISDEQGNADPRN